MDQTTITAATQHDVQGFFAGWFYAPAPPASRPTTPPQRPFYPLDHNNASPTWGTPRPYGNNPWTALYANVYPRLH